MSDAAEIIAQGRAVLAREAEGLAALEATLGNDFAEAVHAIAALNGRVITTGMGKSGHVARKIAATLASTGTPAHFVHPGEASHGDLGMITQADAVLALSNSGETIELSDIIHHTRRFSIPLIGMVRRSNSRLAEAADIALVLPEIAEAAEVAAPTTSTTMMLALGDALAVALLNKRGFTTEDFAAVHPGGTLGKALIRVSDIMHHGAHIPLVAQDAAMGEVLMEMTSKHFGCAGVVDVQGRLVGMVTDGDLRRHIADEALLHQTAQQIMTKAPQTIAPSALAAEALGIMNTRGITSLFAVDQKAVPQGILHIHDCLRAGIS